eukprot:COSAG04_NODE_34_length_34523_cov_40.302446_33_plen_133_part_00
MDPFEPFEPCFPTPQVCAVALLGGSMASGYYRFPALDARGNLAFTSDSDLFLAALPPSLDGLEQIAAARLTRGQGGAAFAAFSGDGATIAFSSSRASQAATPCPSPRGRRGRSSGRGPRSTSGASTCLGARG